jgi:hypothetical protein
MQTNSSFERSNKPQRNKSEQQQERQNKRNKPTKQDRRNTWEAV